MTDYVTDLYGRTKPEWRSAIEKYERIPNEEIKKILEISYEGLDKNEKDIFLDIACFFEGFPKKYVIDILSACNLYPIYGIQRLIDKCLITVGQYDKLLIHDLLQQMGRDIVEQESPDLPGERSRLWCYEDVRKVLTQNTVCIILVHFLPFFQMANVVIIFHLNVKENLSLLV